MAQCQGCGAVMTPQQLQDGLCVDCVNEGRQVKEEYARYIVKKGDKEKAISFGFNWLYFLIGGLLGPIGGMVYAFFSGSLSFGLLYVLANLVVLGVGYFAAMQGDFWVQIAVIFLGEWVLASMYNKVLVKFLLSDGYAPANEQTKQAIKKIIK